MCVLNPNDELGSMRCKAYVMPTTTYGMPATASRMPATASPVLKRGGRQVLWRRFKEEGRARRCWQELGRKPLKG
ncbi:hypothetical protein [Segatella baroniae]|uniref:hypothetical protein n=1 Tax=Segatella baroniae TaxID=305719 RepID=UPI0012DD2B5F|nr:hypothetical protein [Segatella baroniae]